jgi:acetyl esterase/lipase
MRHHQCWSTSDALRVMRARGVIAAAALAACSSTGPDEDTDTGALEAITPVSQCAAESVDVSAIREARNVTYATRAGQPLQFDISWSEGRSPAPLVLLLHGGGWATGTRTHLAAEVRAFARLGYTAATVQYRLTQGGRNEFPAAIIDVRCALRELRRRATEYNIAPERVVAMGYSAGGHLASLLGTGADVPGLDGLCGDTPAGVGSDDVSVQAVVSYAGPQDLRVSGPYTAEQAALVTNFLGVFPGDDPVTATLASPIAHVSAGDPPFLMIHGTDDDLVPVDQSRRMAAALRQVLAPASVIELRGVGHGFVGLSSSDVGLVRCTVNAFLTRWLGQPIG